jgi:hypothetical protein
MSETSQKSSNSYQLAERIATDLGIYGPELHPSRHAEKIYAAFTALRSQLTIAEHELNAMRPVVDSSRRWYYGASEHNLGVTVPMYENLMSPEPLVIQSESASAGDATKKEELMDEKLREGWTWLTNSNKWHYFRDGRSLCGKFGLFPTMNGDFEDGSGVDDEVKCSGCKAKLVRENARKAHA